MITNIPGGRYNTLPLLSSDMYLDHLTTDTGVPLITFPTNSTHQIMTDSRQASFNFFRLSSHSDHVFLSPEEQLQFKKQQQRVNATTRERNRMRFLDQAFRNLAKYLPDLPRNRKPSKQEILSGAIKYIGELEKSLKEAKE